MKKRSTLTKEETQLAKEQTVVEPVTEEEAAKAKKKKRKKILLFVLLGILVIVLIISLIAGKTKDNTSKTSSARNAEINLLDGTEILGLSQGGQQFGFYEDGTYKAAGFLIMENQTYTYETSGKYTVSDGKLSFTDCNPLEVSTEGQTTEWESAVSSVIYESKWTITLTGTDSSEKAYTLAQYDLGKEEADQLGVKGVKEVSTPETSYFDVEDSSTDISSLLSGFSMEDIAAMMGMSSFQTSGSAAEVESYDTSGALVAQTQEGITLAFYKDGTYTLSGTATYEGQKISLSQKDTYSVKNNNLVLDNGSQAVVSADALKQYGMDNLSVSTAHTCTNNNGALTVNITFVIPSYGNQTLGSYTISAEDAAKLGVTGASTDNGNSDSANGNGNSNGDSNGDSNDGTNGGSALARFWAAFLQFFKNLF